jgi:antitoxin YefM
VYAFVVDDVVYYVGAAQRRLYSRLRSYATAQNRLRNPEPAGRRPKRPLHAELDQLLQGAAKGNEFFCLRSMLCLYKTSVQFREARMNAISYSELREKLASVMEQLVANRETVVITRRGHPDVAMLPADELSSLLETVHVLRSPKNAERLFDALRDVSTGQNLRPVTFEELVELAKSPSPLQP